MDQTKLTTKEIILKKSKKNLKKLTFIVRIQTIKTYL